MKNLGIANTIIITDIIIVNKQNIVLPAKMAKTSKASILILVIIGVSIGCVRCDPKFGDDNTCNKTITVRKDKTVDEPHRYEIKYEGMCGILPCTKRRIETRMGSKIKTFLENIQVATCCPGYTESPNHKCLPICLNSCNNGNCIMPGVCKCSPEPTESSPGYAGSTCKRFVCLATNKWGSKCDRECNCPSNSYCSASTGNCLCHSGWRGANCTEECDSTMSDCDGAELPPIVEPEANMIPEVIGQSQRLEALSPRALQGIQSYDEGEVRVSPAFDMLATHLLFCAVCCVTVMLVGAVFWYKRRLDRVEEKLYYVTASTMQTSSPRGGSGGSDYSPYSLYSQASNNIQSRPLPTAGRYPGDLPAKESFESATRNILQASPNIPSKGASFVIGNSEKRAQIIVDPKVESHLISSHESSRQNLYSDPDSTLTFDIAKFGSSDPLISRKPSNAGPANTSGDSYILSVSTNSALESDYQVPKSPRTPTVPINGMIRLNDTFNTDDSNIYEEIHPQTPLKANGRNEEHSEL